MKLVEDADRYDTWQAHFIGEVITSMKSKLEKSSLSPKEARKLTGEIAFSIATLIDGSASVKVDGVELNPILTFAPGGTDLIHTGGNSYMHEYVHGTLDEIFDTPDA